MMETGYAIMRRHLRLDRLSIRHLMQLWALGSVAILVLLVVFSSVTTYWVVGEQQRLHDKVMRINAAADSLKDEITALLLEQRQTLGAEQRNELAQLPPPDEPKRRIDAGIDALVPVTRDTPALGRLLGEVSVGFSRSLDLNAKLRAGMDRLITLREALWQQSSDIDATVQRIENTTEAISGRIDLASSRNRQLAPGGSAQHRAQTLSAPSTAQRAAQQLRNSVSSVVNLTRKLMLASDPDVLLSVRDNEIRQQIALAEQALEALQGHIEPSPELSALARDLADDLARLKLAVLEGETSAYVVRLQNLEVESSLRTLTTESSQALRTVTDDLSEIGVEVSRTSTDAAARFQRAIQVARVITLVSSGLLTIALFALIRVILRRLSAPLEALRRAMHEMSDGKLSTRLVESATVRDEFTELAIDFNRAAATTESLFTQLDGTRANLEASEARMRAILDGVPDGIVTLDREGYILSANPAADKTFGAAAGGLEGRLASELLLIEDTAQGEEASLEAVLRIGDSGHEATGRRLDGSRFPLWLSVSELPHAGDSLRIAVVADTTAFKQAEAARAQSEALFRTIYENVPVMICGFDETGRCFLWNRELERNLGYPHQDVVGDPDIPVMERIYPNPDEYERVTQAIRAADGVFREFSPRSAGGERQTHSWASFALPDGTKICAGYDITGQRQAENRMRYLASYDVLTGLPNRALFNDRLQQALNRTERQRGLLGLLFIDLDHFKNVNDSLGHNVGDKLLQVIGRRISHCLRTQDTVARLGGDEFPVILEQLGQSTDAGKVAQQIIDALSRPCFIEGQEISISPSIGISLYPHDAEDAEALLRNADAAMYHAKKQGRNGFQFYSADMNAAATRRLQLHSSLRHALMKSEYVLHYQPQIEIVTGRTVAVEALLRWQTIDGELVSPDRFIPLLEETGLIVQVGEWVLQQALLECAPLLARGIGLAVNLSGRQFLDPELPARITRALQSSSAPHALIDFEITETVLMEDSETSANNLAQLQSLGFKLSIDDFGTGYSSLAYLKRFPIANIKIDRSFVRDIDIDRNDEAIVEAILAMARRLGINVIAEGVESDLQLSFLARNHCRCAQGFLFSKPLPIDALQDWLAARETDSGALPAGGEPG